MKYLTIFLTNGSTLRFNSISNYEEDLNEIGFDYVSESTNERLHAVFNFSNIAGISYVKE